MIHPDLVNDIYPLGLTRKCVLDRWEFVCYECNKTGQLVVYWDDEFWPTAKTYEEVEWLIPGELRRENKRIFVTCALMVTQAKRRKISDRIQEGI
jgi:hypothetical protein